MQAPSRLPKPRILAVEDEGVVAHDIQQQLTKLGYEPCGRCEIGLGQQCVGCVSSWVSDAVV